MKKRRKSAPAARKSKPQDNKAARPFQPLGPGVRIVTTGPGQSRVIPFSQDDSDQAVDETPDAILKKARAIYQETLNRYGAWMMQADAKRKYVGYLNDHAVHLPRTAYVKAVLEKVSRPECLVEADHRRFICRAAREKGDIPGYVLEDYPELRPDLRPDTMTTPQERWVEVELARLIRPLENRGYVRWDAEFVNEQTGKRQLFTLDPVRAKLELNHLRRTHPEYDWQIEIDEAQETLLRNDGKRAYYLCGRKPIAESERQEIRERLIAEHRSFVERAIEQGVQVSLDILISYPDLLLNASLNF